MPSNNFCEDCSWCDIFKVAYFFNLSDRQKVIAFIPR